MISSSIDDNPTFYIENFVFPFQLLLAPLKHKPVKRAAIQLIVKASIIGISDFKKRKPLPYIIQGKQNLDVIYVILQVINSGIFSLGEATSMSQLYIKGLCLSKITFLNLVYVLYISR